MKKNDIKNLKRVLRDNRLELEKKFGRPRSKVWSILKTQKQLRKEFKAKKYETTDSE